jgi:uncharacterized membrane protein
VRRVQRFRLRHLAQTRLWLLPLTCVLAGIGLAVALLSVDRSIVGTSVTGSAASVQTILTVASTALVTLTSVVLSLTLVAVQLAMGQFSPASCGRSCTTAAASWPSGCSSARSPTR